MLAKSLMVSSAVVVGLLAFDVSAPTLTGATAQAEKANKTTVRSRVTTTTRRIGTGIKTTTSKTITTIKNTKVFGNSNRTLGTSNKTLGTGNTALKGTGLGVVGAGKFNKGPGFVKLGGFTPAPGGKFLALGGRSWMVHNSPYRVYWKNRWRTWAGFGAISAVLIGGTYYWANSYVAVGRPYCSGVTPDGCQLNWQYVGFEDGDGDYQCVQFCPRPSEPAPAQAVALVAPPAAPAGGCQMTIFAEPAFAGLSAPTGENQPRLGAVGWKDQIASLQVESGTWDFFTEEDFHGESMRLAPGPYPQLTPEWNKKIGSFMCVQ